MEVWRMRKQQSAEIKDVVLFKPPRIIPLPEPAFSIRYKGHILGKIILGYEKTIVKLNDPCRVKLGDPAIMSFLIGRVIRHICSRLRASWNVLETDGFLRMIIIDRPLAGEDAVELIRATRWAITKAFSRPLERKSGGVSHE
jgi:hypothetical protein